MNKEIRVLLADQIEMMCEGIRSVLNKADDITFIERATNSCEVLGLSQRHQPDVLLLSLDLPDLSLDDTLSKVQKLSPATKVLAIIRESNSVRQYQLIAAGITGCILQSESQDAFLSGIRAVYQGELWFSQSILQKLLEQNPNERSLAFSMKLTEREVEILKLMARGWSNQQISEVLFITERTVKFHIHNIYTKLGVSSRAQAITWAWQHELGGDS